MEGNKSSDKSAFGWMLAFCYAIFDKRYKKCYDNDCKMIAFILRILGNSVALYAASWFVAGFIVFPLLFILVVYLVPDEVFDRYFNENNDFDDPEIYFNEFWNIG